MGGLGIDEFLRRQRLHRDAENRAMVDVKAFMDKAREIYGYQHFLNDTGGSICEINSPDAEKVIADNTLVLYIRADENMEQALIERAQSDPKPLYYNEEFLRSKVAEYLSSAGIDDVDSIDPKAFSKWIFPELVKHRRPLYQGLADKYGYTVTAQEAEQVQSESDFLDLIEAAISRS